MLEIISKAPMVLNHFPVDYTYLHSFFAHIFIAILATKAGQPRQRLKQK